MTCAHSPLNPGAAAAQVRKLRQAPAHALNDDAFDAEIFRRQRKLLLAAYQAVRMLRLILANHPAARMVEVNPFLYRGENAPLLLTRFSQWSQARSATPPTVPLPRTPPHDLRSRLPSRRFDMRLLQPRYTASTRIRVDPIAERTNDERGSSRLEPRRVLKRTTPERSERMDPFTGRTDPTSRRRRGSAAFHALNQIFDGDCARVRASTMSYSVPEQQPPSPPSSGSDERTSPCRRSSWRRPPRDARCPEPRHRRTRSCVAVAVPGADPRML